MNVIYEPKGRAKEYSELAVNLYRGCGHGCQYCYAPSVLRMTREGFFENPQPRKGVIEKLEKDAKEIAGDPRPVLLCFTCDPYQPIDKEFRLTRKAIQILHKNELKVRILTKAGGQPTRDFDLLSARPDLSEFGCTLVFNRSSLSACEEEGVGRELMTAPESERILALELAKVSGISTWVSFEPVFDPEQVYELIRASHHCVDRYSVGRLNHRKPDYEFDLVEFRETVTEMLQELGKPYYIKQDLAEA